ncbi:MAG: PDZ domain-containing protein [Cyclobacteriaceae bacterium]
MKKLLPIFFLLILPFVSQSQGTRLLRQPTISDKHIVFVHANDLWIVNKGGGNATRITSSEGAESYPHFSRDGKWIAFTGEYDGNTDVFVIPVEGGAPKRLTWHPGADVVQGWSPDGNSVVFRSSREGVPTRLNKFYEVPAKGGFPSALPIPRIAFGELSADGKYAAYIPITVWDPEWRNYRGGMAMPVWIQNLKTNELIRVPQVNKERHQDPVWLNGTVFFLSERDYANNIWSYNLQTKDYKQHTFHSQFDIKSLDASDSEIVYEQGGYLHTLDPVTNKSTQLIITAEGDLNWARERWEDISASDLQNPQISPNGKRAIFEYRGDIFTVPKENGSWRNLTRRSGSAQRAPVWSPNGQEVAWFSDESGEYQLEIADQYGKVYKSIALPNNTFYFRPEWSPNGKFIAYTDTDFNLWVLNLETEKATKVDTERYAHPNRSLNPSWSPDSRWIAYVKLSDAQFKVVKAYNIESREIIDISDEMADAVSPVWDLSGKYLYFLASTDYGLNTGWLDMSSYNIPVTRALYAAVLSKDDPSPIVLKSDDEEEDSKNESSEKETTVRIDKEGLYQRIIALDIPEKNYTYLVGGPEKTVFYAESIADQSGVTLHKYDLTKQESEKFISGISNAIVAANREHLLYNTRSSWGIVSTSGGQKKTSDGKLTINLKKKIVPTEEWQQIFREAWRFQRDFLYVNNVHGAPWDKIYEWYQPWVKHVKHRQDMNYLIDILGGEVSVGHSYTRGGDYPDVKKIPIGLLGADYEIKNNAYSISKIYTGENWNPDLKSPLSGPGINVKEGDYLVGVNGRPLDATINLYSLFEYTPGEVTTIHINSKPGMDGSRAINVQPVSRENLLRARAWIESNRRRVSELSNGQLGYVYIPNTSRAGYTSFNRYYFSQQGKKGMVIDERNNGGGSAADYMVDVMSRKLQGYFNSKVGDHRPWTTPMAAVWGPKVMIINERAGSGGDLLPYLFRQKEIGPLVGTRTWGGLVGTWDTPLFIDGGRMVAPRGGFFDTEGKWAVEGDGVAPDIEVIQTPKMVLKGIDPQLEKAVEVALDLMKTEKVDLKPEPAPPVKWKRPRGTEKDQ